MSEIDDLKARLTRLDQMIDMQTDVLEKQQALMKELQQARVFTADLLDRLESAAKEREKLSANDEP